VLVTAIPTEPLDAAPARGSVPLLLDAGPDELEVEAALVPGCKHLSDDALERDVAVAGNEPVGCRQGAHRVVTHLDEADPVDAAGNRGGEIALGPARVHFHADAGVEPPRDVQHVAQ
jgi:hypothetical protein